MTPPRVLVLADTPGWAWDRKARAYRRYLSDRYAITVAYHAAVPPFHEFDLIHFFEVSQVDLLHAWPPAGRPFKVVAGLTAHVWPTWGAARMRRWAEAVDALHGNSLLLVKDLQQFHPRVYYTPNGVDATFWQRTGPWPLPPVFGHVGKPNPRKGAVLMIEAARRVGAELRLCVRTSKLALSAEALRAWYQDVTVQVTASDMDGTPNPMLEAAACSNALLSTPIGNMPEFIQNGGNGFLVERTVDALAEKMAWFRAHPAQTLLMGSAARATVLADWRWETQVEHVAQLWAEVLG